MCEILNAFNNKRIVGGIFFDLERALDCVNHSILLLKLEFYVIMYKAYTLIKYYPEGRQQIVIFMDRLLNNNNNTGYNWVIV